MTLAIDRAELNSGAI